MDANAPKLITLSCPSCGAKLNISPNLDRFACAFCGQEHIVNRGGGTISLSPVVEAIHQVKTGVDKTAAELAIVRLQKEISNLQVLKQNKLEKLKDRPIYLYALGSIIIGAISFCIASSVNKYNGVFLGIGVILILIGVLISILSSRKRNAWEVSVRQNVSHLDRQIAEKQIELERNKNLVRN
jgi:hypothetical protein